MVWRPRNIRSQGGSDGDATAKKSMGGLTSCLQQGRGICAMGRTTVFSLKFHEFDAMILTSHVVDSFVTPVRCLGFSYLMSC